MTRNFYQGWQYLLPTSNFPAMPCLVSLALNQTSHEAVKEKCNTSFVSKYHPYPLEV